MFRCSERNATISTDHRLNISSFPCIYSDRKTTVQIQSTSGVKKSDPFVRIMMLNFNADGFPEEHYRKDVEGLFMLRLKAIYKSNGFISQWSWLNFERQHHELNFTAGLSWLLDMFDYIHMYKNSALPINFRVVAVVAFFTHLQTTGRFSVTYYPCKLCTAYLFNTNNESLKTLRSSPSNSWEDEFF